jgi:hypothetical protein
MPLSITRLKHPVRRPLQLALLLGPWIFGLAGADSPDDAVRWTATLRAGSTITRGSTATIDVLGEVGEGWHVYAIEQHSGGPTPLRITLDANETAAAAGPASGTVAETVHDTHFGFDTQLYTHSFTVHLPVRVGQQLPAGRQLIPVSVRFQACSDRECLLPRTIHLSVPIDVPTAG